MKNHLRIPQIVKFILLFLVFLFKESYSQSVQQRLDFNQSPLQIFNSGFPLDSIYGKSYQGGLIFYLDTVIGNGLVCAPEDQSAGAEWGCYGISIAGTSTALYFGNANSIAIVSQCPSTGIAGTLCYELELNSFNDWYLPSRTELLLMVSNLGSANLGGLNGIYWSSTQYNPTHAYTNILSVVSQKYSYYKVRAIRCFCSAYTCPCQEVSLPVHELVQWEIFHDKMSPDFNTLKNTGSIPSQSISLDSLNVTNFSSSMDYFSSRIRGYIIPPTSGMYSFYFACDDKGQFWLSTDTASANAVLKSQIDSIQTDWTQNISYQTLVAGQKYFFEILQYDSVYTNVMKLGWIIPGNTIPESISSIYMAGYYDSIEVNSLKFVYDTMTVYPNWNITPQYHITPWNAAYKTVIWKSSNNSIATVNVDGKITTISAGMCQIIVMSALNTTLADTLTLTVSDYYGPFFVKQNATINGDGHSWDNAIPFTKLLDILNQDLITGAINVYIAEGTYKPTTSFDRNKTFLLNNMRIVGGFDSTISGSDTINRDFQNHETILSGEIGMPGETLDNSYHVVTTKGHVTVDGLTIREGRANCRMYGDGNIYQLNENQGGGLFVKSVETNLLNCKITNNSAFNSGGGIFAGFFDPSYYWSNNLDNKTINIQNCIIRDNLIQQNVPIGGGMFYIVVNGFGPAFIFQHGTINLRNCTFYGNNTPNLQPVCRFTNSIANIDNCSFFDNPGSSTLGVYGLATLNMNNSTVNGQLLMMFNPNAYIKNSTIIGGASQISDGIINVFLDNTIWTGVTLAELQSINLDPQNSFQAKYSIIGNSLIGDSYENLILSTVPNYISWLDTLANNGGVTPTMKLKNVLNNPAKSYGNLLYLGTTDQRGSLRIDSVSIGAYQYDFPNTGIVEVKAFPEG
ncbi:MAG: PA14 domain-containing protein, partial [Bacteroidales bacterium]